MQARGEVAKGGEGEQREKGAKGGRRGRRGAKGAKESEAYSILGFRVPTTSVCKQGVR